MPSVYNSTDSAVLEDDNGLRLSEGSKLFFFLIICVSNVLFLAYWAYKMIEEIKNTMRTKMGKLYMYIFLCGNKKRFEDEKIRRAVQDENDILKEEFDRQLNEIRDLWNPNPQIGKLVLNRVNIEKSALYLHPKNYLKSVMARKELTEDELKQIKRMKRKFEGERRYQRMFNKIEPLNYDEDNHFEDNLEPDLDYQGNFEKIDYNMDRKASSNDKSVTDDEI
mmetsp:Transcript_42048/g.48761  ORF Transcript_42048/g.48761 Transcript_42048/m.48761 type:complete len:222 (-) Transcript_42048:778-1443(-)